MAYGLLCRHMTFLEALASQGLVLSVTESVCLSVWVSVWVSEGHTFVESQKSKKSKKK